ncbi:MAG: hypothetical protein H6644_19635 [Caldilineaceae bacterium]|nr:hypothetical protein [Caldilineaceae bacterium]
MPRAAALIPVADADVVTLIGTHLPTAGGGRAGPVPHDRAHGHGHGQDRRRAPTELGIVVSNTPYFCIEEQADHAWAG